MFYICITIKNKNTMRHFATRKEANAFAKEKNKFHKSVHVFKKLKGHKNRIKKPFVVGSEMEWFVLN